MFKVRALNFCFMTIRNIPFGPDFAGKDGIFFSWLLQKKTNSGPTLVHHPGMASANHRSFKPICFLHKQSYVVDLVPCRPSKSE